MLFHVGVSATCDKTESLFFQRECITTNSLQLTHQSILSPTGCCAQELLRVGAGAASCRPCLGRLGVLVARAEWAELGQFGHEDGCSGEWIWRMGCSGRMGGWVVLAGWGGLWAKGIASGACGASRGSKEFGLQCMAAGRGLFIQVLFVCLVASVFLERGPSCEGNCPICSIFVCPKFKYVHVRTIIVYAIAVLHFFK